MTDPWTPSDELAARYCRVLHANYMGPCPARCEAAVLALTALHEAGITVELES